MARSNGQNSQGNTNPSPANAPAPVVDNAAPLGFNTAEVVDQVVNMFTGYVNDVTDPRFTAFVADLATDAAKLAFAKADTSSDPALIAEMQAAFDARASALSHVPGIMAAGRVNIFLGVAKNVFAGLVTFGANALRQYATGFAASVKN